MCKIFFENLVFACDIVCRIFGVLSITLDIIVFGIILGPACLILTISGFARQFFRNIERENDLREEESKQEKANERQGIWKEAFEDQEESDPK